MKIYIKNLSHFDFVILKKIMLIINSVSCLILYIKTILNIIWNKAIMKFYWNNNVFIIFSFTTQCNIEYEI